MDDCVVGYMASVLILLKWLDIIKLRLIILFLLSYYTVGILPDLVLDVMIVMGYRANFSLCGLEVPIGHGPILGRVRLVVTPVDFNLLEHFSLLSKRFLPMSRGLSL